MCVFFVSGDKRVYDFAFEQIFWLRHRNLNVETGVDRFQKGKSVVEQISAIPWGEYTEENGIQDVRNVLEKEFFRSEQLTECVVEHVALKEKGWSLWITGSAGQGKFTAAKTVTKALNRKFCTIHMKDLTGERLRGGPRAKTSALAKCLIQAKCMNPVIYLKDYQDVKNEDAIILEIRKIIGSGEMLLTVR